MTPRRWIRFCNPDLSEIVTKWIHTEDWVLNTEKLAELRKVIYHFLIFPFVILLDFEIMVHPLSRGFTLFFWLYMFCSFLNCIHFIVSNTHKISSRSHLARNLQISYLRKMLVFLIILRFVANLSVTGLTWRNIIFIFPLKNYLSKKKKKVPV